MSLKSAQVLALVPKVFLTDMSRRDQPRSACNGHWGVSDEQAFSGYYGGQIVRS
jgi:hypothetical protein